MEAHSSDERPEQIASAQLASDGAADGPTASKSVKVAVADGASGEPDREEELSEVVLDLGELNAGAVIEDDAIEVSDEELTEVTALGDATRSTTRSVPPPRPSLRVPRTSAPPPRRQRSSLLPGQPTMSSIPAARISSPPGAVLADLRLALAQSRARVEDLTARFEKSEAARSNAEQRLRAALQRIAELERLQLEGGGAEKLGLAADGDSHVAQSSAAGEGGSIVTAHPSAEGHRRTKTRRPAEAKGEASPSKGAGFAEDRSKSGEAPRALSANSESGTAATGGPTEQERPPSNGGDLRSAKLDATQDADLQKIEGIGPRFEATLRKHGVTRVSQVAAWSDADIKRIAKRMKIPRSRIVKGRWVERAREVLSDSPAQ